MTRWDVLELLRELVQKSGKAIPEENDPSGCFTDYVVDQELLLQAIDEEMRQEAQ